MAMADFNKDNPFIIIMKNRSSDVNRLSMNLIKTFIISSLCMLAISILGIVTLHSIIILIPTIIFILFNAYLIINLVRGTEMKQVDQMIYGNQYSVIDINNEDVLKIIEQLDYIRGKMSNVISMLSQNVIIICIIYFVLFLVHKI